MQKYPIYAIVAIVFVGIIKLLQVTVFDVEQYSKNKENSFSQSEIKAEKPVRKKETAITKPIEQPEKSEESQSEDTISDNIQNTDSQSNDTETDTSNDASFEDNSFDDATESTASNTTYDGLSDLKNLYLAPKIANLPPGQLREDVVIRYYRHQQDGEKVFSLKELGYYIHEKEANETAGLGSNVIYYGDDVNTEDIQIVAYTLLEGGLPLKAITPTQFSWKSNSIEIGTDTLLLNSVNLTEAAIKDFSK